MFNEKIKLCLAQLTYICMLTYLLSIFEQFWEKLKIEKEGYFCWERFIALSYKLSFGLDKRERDIEINLVSFFWLKKIIRLFLGSFLPSWEQNQGFLGCLILLGLFSDTDLSLKWNKNVLWFSWYRIMKVIVYFYYVDYSVHSKGCK